MSHRLTCKECGGKFDGRTVFTTFCSDRCRMRAWRRTEKGMACVVRSNAKVKRPDIDKVCGKCKKSFVTARESQVLCSICSPKYSAYESQKKYRKNNVEKVRLVGRVNKQAQRRFYYAECCIIKGCLNEGHRHHPDYDKSYEIVWLCRQHHKDAHTGKGRSVFTRDEIRSDLKDDSYYQKSITV